MAVPIGGAGPAAAEDAVIRSLAVRELDDRTEVILATSEKLEWSARQLLDGRLILKLPGTYLDPAVADLEFPDGLVSTVTAGSMLDGSIVTTTIAITPRSRPSYSVSAAPGELLVTLRARADSPGSGRPAEGDGEAAGANAGAEPPLETASALPAPAIEPAEIESPGVAVEDTTEIAAGVPAAETAAEPEPGSEATRPAEPEAQEVEIGAPAGPAVPVDPTAGDAGGRRARADSAAIGAQTPSFAPAPAAAAAAGGEYYIGPGDVLEISVFGLRDFDRSVRVLRDGSISLPLLGAVRIAGETLQQAQMHIASLLAARELVKEPQVSIFVKEYVSRGISIQGAVEKPGAYQMIQQRTLLEMLGEAGGLSGGSGKRAGQQIFVIRQGAAGSQDRIEIDADALINQGRADLNIPLLPGDVVLVPFAQMNRVYVSGAVVRPGPVEYLSSEGITVLQAITAAGGPSERGNLGNIAIVRKLEGGGEERLEVNAKKIQKGKLADVALVRNDTVIVGEWFF